MFVKSNGFGTEALILLDFPPFLRSFFESEFPLVGNPQEVKGTQAQAKYDKGHTTGVYMKLNTGTDQDILAWLDKQGSKQGAIKQLIREEIRRTAQ